MNKLFFLLLSCIVAYNSVNAMEQFPLHRAVIDGDIEHVKALLLSNNGADINLRDIRGRTPLYYAANECHEAIVELLLSRGADINLQGRSGQIATSGDFPGAVPQIITNFQQRMQRAEQKVQKVEKVLSAILSGDEDQSSLREIIEFSRKAILQQARESRQQISTTNSWCIIS